MSETSVQLAVPGALNHDYEMAHDEAKVLNVNTAPLEGVSYSKKQFGIAAPVAAVVKAGRQRFSILDTRYSSQMEAPFVIVEDAFDFDKDDGYKGVWQDESLTIGREYHKDRFNYDKTVSRSHFSVLYDGLGLVIANRTPLNGTKLTGNFAEDTHYTYQTGNVDAIFTQMVEEDMRQRHDFGYKDEHAPYGYYRNHAIIGRDSSSVKNGVYFTTYPNSEAVVVDDRSRVMQHAAQGLLQQVEKKFGYQPTVPTKPMLELVNKYTQKLMRYDLECTEALSSPLYGTNGLIGLSEYVQEGIGVCRQQCLLAAFLLETLVDANIMPGKVSVERNHDIDAHGAHAWTMFKVPGGEAFVVDPAQKFVGTKQQARKEGRWKYSLPADS